MISFDRFDIRTPQRIGNGIKKKKILHIGLEFMAYACINLGIEFSTLSWKETLTTRINVITDENCNRYHIITYTKS